VYEGLTQYLGMVLAARSGLNTPELSKDEFAATAELAKFRAARAWRPLVDTAVSAPFLYNAPGDWESRGRSVDFYGDGALIWLEADTLIREKTDGKKSLDDFCKAFYGGTDGPPEVKSYSFEDVVTTLNGVVPNEWAAFFDRRLNNATAEAPLDGLTHSGWQLVYSNKPSELLTTGDEKDLDLRSSVGLIVGEGGTIRDVVPGSAADKAAVGPGMKLLAANDRHFKPDRLKEAVAATKSGDGKITLLLENGDYFQSVVLQYDGGTRYPHLERITSSPDRLGDIFKATTTPDK
jgi:predicted metalloprotease with PDZ domain